MDYDYQTQNGCERNDTTMKQFNALEDNKEDDFS